MSYGQILLNLMTYKELLYMNRDLKKEFLNLYEEIKTNKNSKIFSLLIEALFIFYRDLWINCSDSLEELYCPVYNNDEKKRNERKIDELLDNLLITLKSLDKGDDSLAEEKLKKIIYGYVRNSNIFKFTISSNYPYDFIASANNFINKAKKFDPYITSADIFQALRNVWTMKLLQTTFSMDVELTYPIFSYSMLYPYTDNLIDSNQSSNTEKKERCNRLMERLKGSKLIPHNIYEEKVFRLVEKIEENYPRRYFYCLYQSLIAINTSQIESLKQYECKENENIEDIIKLSFIKGGLSVLTDAYLIKGSLTIEEIMGAFGLGILLQLIDDLQDIKQDKKSGSTTIFTYSLRKQTLTRATVKLLNFARNIIELLPNEKSPYYNNIKNVLKTNCYLLIFFSISRVAGQHTKEFIDRIETYYPFTPSYMKNFNSKLNNKWSSIKKLRNITVGKVFDILLEDDINRKSK